VIEAVPAVVAVTAEIKVDLRSLRQPELYILSLKKDGPILHNLVFAEELNRLNRTDQFRFNAHDLKFVARDPGSPF